MSTRRLVKSKKKSKDVKSNPLEVSEGVQNISIYAETSMCPWCGRCKHCGQPTPPFNPYIPYTLLPYTTTCETAGNFGAAQGGDTYNYQGGSNGRNL